MNRFLRRRRLWTLLAASCTFAILPLQCGNPILHAVTPILLDGGNPFLTRLISLVAPLVLP